MNAQKKVTDQILINDNRFVSDGRSLLPIVIIESVSDNLNNKNIEIKIANTEFSNATIQSIQNTIYSTVTEFNWRSNSVDRDLLSEFSKLNEKSTSSSRVKDLTIKLFQQSNYESL
jgi:hypothetical protein